MTYLIIEPEHKGHYIILYIKFIVRLISIKNSNVIILTTKKTSRHKSFKTLFKEHKKIKIEYIKYIKPKNSSTLSILFYQIRLFFLIKSAYKKISKKYKVDHIFLNSLDHFDKAIFFFGDPFFNVNFSGIYVNPKFHLKKYNLGIAGRYNYISKIFFKKLLLISNLKNILTNDKFFIDYINKNKFKYSYKLKFLREPREFSHSFTKDDSRKILKLPENRFYILVYGALKKTKGINELLLALSSDNINNKVSVILAGEQDEYVKSLLKFKISKLLLKKKKLFVFNGFKDEKEESILFSASDVVWVGYQKTFPFLSGVLYQAAIKNLPIIASNNGIIGWMNKKYKLGFSVDVNNCNLITKTINKLCQSKIYNSFSSSIFHFAQKAHPKFFMKQINDLLIKKY
jgi:glycosyltransferase involved in cell wall biosynthesis